MVDHVHITDVVLRDGLQNEPAIVTTARKREIADGLIAAGVRSLEVGSFVHPDRVPQMADTDALVRELAAAEVELHTLVFNAHGAERAVAAGARHARLVVSASESHSRENAGVATDDALARQRECVGILSGAGIAIEACVATAFVCPFDGPTPVRRAVAVAEALVDMGVEALALADTIGNASPSQVVALLAALQPLTASVGLGLHLHDTYGMAAACVMAGLQAGVTRFDASLGGLGGCPFAPGASGNVATDDLVHLLHREGISTGIDPQALARVRDTVALAVGHPLGSALARASSVPAALEARP